MAVARSLIVSAFEAELQPLTCACAGAAPREHGVDVAGWDAPAAPEAIPLLGARLKETFAAPLAAFGQ
jgi:hypothetical protein